ncbi:MAG TPA: hypothetical protein DCM87_14815 [Planctomycetes bacterium]|nr:hypothetical protein [Planctomycetota bacterium]
MPCAPVIQNMKAPDAIVESGGCKGKAGAGEAGTRRRARRGAHALSAMSTGAKSTASALAST